MIDKYLPKLTFTVAVRTIAVGPPTQPDYVPLTPARLVDTRLGFTTVDSVNAGEGLRSRGTTLQFQVAGRGGVAADAVAASPNVTAVDALGGGFLTVYPCGSAQPLASNVNYSIAGTIPNAVLAKLGTGGTVCIFASEPTHLVVDINGYFPSTTSYRPLDPARLVDTRPEQLTVDGLQQASGKNADGNTMRVHVTGRGGVAADATSAALNVTVTQQDAPGFTTVFPCGANRPLSSSLNSVAGQTIPNLVVTDIGTDGDVCIYTQSTTHLVVDVNGYFPTVTRFHGIEPARLADTRVGFDTVDHVGPTQGYRDAGTTTVVHVTGRAGVPANATTAMLNVTATEAGNSGFVTVFPCGVERPLASNLNYVTGQTIPNAALTKIGVNGTVCLYTSQPTHLVVDVTGFFTD